MKELRGTKISDDLIKVYQLESNSNMVFEIYSKVADNENYKQIANEFRKISENRKAHAKVILKYLIDEFKSNEICKDDNSPFYFGTTYSNLIDAVKGEFSNYSNIYAEFAKDAYEEKFPDIASTLNMISAIHKRDNELLFDIMDKITTNTYFERDEKTNWICQGCGYKYQGYKMGDYCPLCNAPKECFQIIN